MRRNQRKQQKQNMRKIASNNIQELFSAAINKFKENVKFANRYVKIALKTRDKSNVRLTKRQKSLFCKKCHSLLIPGTNCSVRIKNKYTIYHCKECGSMRKFGLRLKENKKNN